MSATSLHPLVEAVAPIHGIAGPYPAAMKDKLPWPASTLYAAKDGTLWRIDFTAEATPAQITAASTVVAGFSPSGAPLL